jgi:cell division control protein 45
MVYLPPPQYASASRPSYAEAYNKILATHRRSPLTSASSIIILVAPDVDALCAAKMLAQLFKQDDVMHKVVPVAGIADLEKTRDELITQTEVCMSLVSSFCGVTLTPNSVAYVDSVEHGCYLGSTLVRVVW